LFSDFYRKDSSDEAVVVELLSQHSGYSVQGYLLCQSLFYLSHKGVSGQVLCLDRLKEVDQPHHAIVLEAVIHGQAQQPVESGFR
jgi:hypothetical protein